MVIICLTYKHVSLNAPDAHVLGCISRLNYFGKQETKILGFVFLLFINQILSLQDDDIWSL